MEAHNPLEHLQAVLSQQLSQTLSEAERALLRGAWLHQTYEETAVQSGYSVNYLQRDLGPKFWKRLSDVTGRTLNKTNAAVVLQQWLEQITPRPVTPTPIPTQEVPPSSLFSNPMVDWGEAPDASVFYGRAEEVSQLQTWIERDRCRLVAILGMGGMGKSTLAARVAQQLQPTFERIIWRSVRHAPTLDTVLTDLTALLSGQQETQPKLERLLHWLRTHRCLVILDNVESIMTVGERAGHYAQAYANYGDLFRVLATASHQSCVMLTSREKPAELSVVEGIGASAQSLVLKGSREAALALLEAKAVQASAAEKEQLIQFYDANPLSLKIVASSIQSLFDGDVSTFLQEDTLIFNGLNLLLSQHFDRLSELEKSIMYWLAINREWTSAAELMADIVPGVSRSRILECLESLTWRSLIEKQAGHYSQQPVVMEYVSHRLIDIFKHEFLAGELHHLLSLALMKVSAKLYVRESQLFVFVQPLAQAFQEHFPNPAKRIAHMQSLVAKIRAIAPPFADYGAGNLLTIGASVGMGFSGFDFSGLTIQQANLHPLQLVNVNFRGADFQRVIFKKIFDGVFGLAFNADGSLLATGHANGLIRIWQVASRQLVTTLSGHRAPVFAVAFDPQGSRLASGSADGTVRLWSVETGMPIAVYDQPQQQVWAVSWHPQGTQLVAACFDGWIRLWDVASHTLLRQWGDGQVPVFAVMFHPQGSLVASGHWDQQIRLWDPDSGTLVKTLSGHTDQVLSVQFSPDGTRLLSGSVDQTVRLWMLPEGQLQKTLVGHSSHVFSVRFFPSGTMAVSSSFDYTLKIWTLEGTAPETEPSYPLATLIGHTNQVMGLDVSPTGSLIASGGQDYTIRLWEATSGKAITTMHGYSAHVRSLAFHPTGSLIVTGHNDHALRLWDPQTRALRATLSGHKNHVSSVAWDGQGSLIASASMDGTLAVWSADRQQCLQMWSAHSNQIWTVAFHPHQPFLVSASVDRTVKVWDPYTGTLRYTLPPLPDWALSVTFSPDGATLIVAGCDGAIHHWDWEQQSLRQVVPGHQGWVFALAVNPQGSLVASASADQTVKIWDLTSGELRHTLSGHQAWVHAVAFDPQGRWLASACQDHTIKLWDPQRGELIRTLSGHTHTVSTVAFHPQTGELVSGSGDETLRFWDPESGTVTAVVPSPRPCEGMIISGATGMTAAQRLTLVQLGAIQTDP
ncbi:MAG: NB-ARC domain-containing protein [Synechococcales cyanobacterium]